MLKVQKTAPTIIPVNAEAVQSYEQYFHYLLTYNTFELILLNDQIYYTFSDMPFKEWQEQLAHTTGVIQATEFLDRFQIQQLSVLSVKTVKDVTTTVKEQYSRQKQVIYDSYALVKRIITHSEKRIVRDAVTLIEKSRANTESKRRYWRVLNERYYGLDIHPLMEYELDELQRILFACEHYDENPNYAILSWVLTASAVISGGVVVGYMLLQVI